MSHLFWLTNEICQKVLLIIHVFKCFDISRFTVLRSDRFNTHITCTTHLNMNDLRHHEKQRGSFKNFDGRSVSKKLKIPRNFLKFPRNFHHCHIFCETKKTINITYQLISKRWMKNYLAVLRIINIPNNIHKALINQTGDK